MSHCKHICISPPLDVKVIMRKSGQPVSRPCARTVSCAPMMLWRTMETATACRLRSSWTNHWPVRAAESEMVPGRRKAPLWILPQLCLTTACPTPLPSLIKRTSLRPNVDSHMCPLVATLHDWPNHQQPIIETLTPNRCQENIPDALLGFTSDTIGPTQRNTARGKRSLDINTHVNCHARCLQMFSFILC